MSLRRLTLHGLKWQIGTSLVQKLVSFCTTIVIARILGPANYGLFALALVVINSFGLFKSMGLDTALIQRKGNTEVAASTAFFTMPIIGCVLYLFLFVSAPFLAKFLNNQELDQIVKVLGIIFVVSSIVRVPTALLEKQMEFKSISLIEMASGFVFSAVALILAFLQFQVWSLVYAYIARSLTNGLGIFFCARWSPLPTYDFKIAAELFHFGKFIFLGGIVWFAKMNLDNVLVGKLLGTTALGLYAVAFNLSTFPRAYIGSQILRVMYPAYSKKQTDLANLRSAFLKTLQNVSLIAIPFSAGLFFLGEDFLKVAYGNKWSEAAPVLRVMAWLGMLHTISAVIEPLIMAIGKSNVTFYITLIEVCIYLLLIEPVSKLAGLYGVGLVVTFSGFISLILGLFLTKKYLFLDYLTIFGALKLSLLSSFVMAIFIALSLHFTSLFSVYISRFMFFILITIFSVIVYILTIYLKNKSIFNQFH